MKTEEQIRVEADIARRLMYSLLLRVEWSDCKIQRGGIQLPDQFDAAIERAARDLKALGLGWETWT